MRFFNSATGTDGLPYAQKTADRICDELGKPGAMLVYVSEVSGTYLCEVRSGELCTPEERAWIDGWKVQPTAEEVHQELDALAAQAEEAPKDAPKEREWIARRVSMLKQLAVMVTAEGKEEL
mmetsp:Transcript_24812/g.62795  ORF Transcript_24812/g.62795 Transcript_24812/m.62795 type:complete len:122 (+) Transcript_24812:416-781(+)